MNQKILKNLENLPILNNTLIEVQKIKDNFEIGVNEIVAIIEKDPMETTNLLKTINNPLYNVSNKEITNLKQAITMLGITKTFAILLNNNIHNLLKFDMRPYNTNQEDFAKLSILQSSLMREICEGRTKETQDIAFLAALVQEIGKVIISNIIIEEEEVEDFSEDIENTNNIEEIEFSYVETNTNTITSEILTRWGIEKKITDLIIYSAKPEEASEDIKNIAKTLNVVKTAIPINSPLSDKSIKIALKKAELFGLDKNRIERAINIVKERLNKPK